MVRFVIVPAITLQVTAAANNSQALFVVENPVAGAAGYVEIAPVGALATTAMVASIYSYAWFGLQPI